MPDTLNELLKEGGAIFGIEAVAVRTYPEEAKVLDLNLLRSGAVVVLLTSHEEASFPVR